MPRDSVVQTTLTIPSGQAKSNALDLHAVNGVLTGMSILTPSQLTGKVIALESSLDGVAFAPLMFQDALITLSIPGRVYHVQLNPAVSLLRIASSVAEGTARAFVVAAIYTIPGGP